MNNQVLSNKFSLEQSSNLINGDLQVEEYVGEVGAMREVGTSDPQLSNNDRCDSQYLGDAGEYLGDVGVICAGDAAINGHGQHETLQLQ